MYSLLIPFLEENGIERVFKGAHRLTFQANYTVFKQDCKNRASSVVEPSGALAAYPKYSPSPWPTASCLPAVKEN